MTEHTVVIAGDGPTGLMLIRPDGHIVWTGDLTDPALAEALATWFGTAA